ncbi:MAG: hypothetical protein ACYTAF_03400 [Planctomycetota bacterium]|jgi:hypothetical protein
MVLAGKVTEENGVVTFRYLGKDSKNYPAEETISKVYRPVYEACLHWGIPVLYDPPKPGEQPKT